MKLHEFTAGGYRLAAASWGEPATGRPTVVMLHGGLDCISTWKDLPETLARVTGLPVLAYDRYGYGRSARRTINRSIEYRYEESGPVLGDLLRHFGIAQTVLFGHSDGGAMSVLAAAAHPDAVRGVYACAPTIVIDASMMGSMVGAKRAFEHEGLRERLARHHGDNTDAMFSGWYDPWIDPASLRWDMSGEIAAVRCPVSALFGCNDEYGWRPSAEALLHNGVMPLEVVALPAVGHHPQHQARSEVLPMFQRLLGRIAGATKK